MPPRLLCLLYLLGVVGGQYLPQWSSLDSRPLPPWYDQAKVGIFLHWGSYAVPSTGSRGTAWFWKFWKDDYIDDYVQYMKENYKPDFSYQEFAPQFTAEFFDPEQWARIFNASGARYVVLTSKHHEGYTLWPSKHSWGWNSMDVGPHRDLVGELAGAVRKVTPHIHFGLYYSHFDFFNPLWLDDAAHLFTTNNYVMTNSLPHLHELVNTYQPEIVWSDGDWQAPSYYWQSKEFLAWLFNESPVKDTVVVNDRWGIATACHHGSFYTCHDRYNPGVLQAHKWENAMTLDRKAWGHHRTSGVLDYLTPHELVTILAQTISCGGNLLVNTGPTKEGTIDPIMEERLRQLGSWLHINGEAVYESQPWIHQNDSLTPGVWYTARNGLVYAMVLTWPQKEVLTLGSVQPGHNTTVTMLGYSSPLQFEALQPGVRVHFPDMSEVQGEWAWVLAFSHVAPNTLAHHKKAPHVEEDNKV